VAGRLVAISGSVLFFFLAPGTIAGCVPYALTRWRPGPPLAGVPGERIAGVVLVAAGAAVLIECFRRFALVGRGTPAPVVPTETLVASGLYRHVRNPMYLGVVAVVAGQALLLGRVVLLRYAAVVWLLFHVFVLLYEEPTLRWKYGAAYDEYRAHVRRWWPRIRPWRG
jgi:protein-S-isoprenylcysteine O-methyltransferase Ste14